jgi:hypothetical protein
MRGMLLLLCLSAAPCLSADYSLPSRSWQYSLAALSTANALDMHSSWGRRELNPMLASSDGRFGARGAALKLGIQATLFGLEYVITRRHPGRRTYRVLSILNFGAAGVAGATAIHNYTLPGPRR